MATAKHRKKTGRKMAHKIKIDQASNSVLIINASRSVSQIAELSDYLTAELSGSKIRYIAASSIKEIPLLRRFKKVIVLSNSPISTVAAILVSADKRILLLHDNELHAGKKKFAERVSRAVLILYTFFFSNEIIVSFQHQNQILPKLHRNSTLWTVRLPYVRSIYNAAPSRVGCENNYFLFFGRLESYKGLDRLDQIAKSLKDNERIIVAGKGDWTFSSTKVIKIGQVSNRKLSELIVNAVGCLFPYTSGTGTQAPQTALSLKTPCLMSNIPMFKDNFREGCVICDFKNDVSIRDCLGKLRSLADHPLDLREDYTPEKWAQNVLNV